MPRQKMADELLGEVKKIPLLPARWRPFVVAGVCVLLFAAALLAFSPRRVSGNLDAFAKCLAAKGVAMYGADWCPHCQKEKQAFGGSFRFVPYVECPADPQRCVAAGVRGYPTWIFNDGRRLEGEQGLKNLAAASGCPLPSENMKK